MVLKKKDFISIILLFGLITMFFGTLIFTDATFYHRDIAKYYYPTKFFSTESIQNGQIPFWNPYLFCGTPFLATLQHGLFYPLGFLYYLLPFNIGFKYFFIIHFFLAGLFLYLLMRKLDLGIYSSSIGSIIFVLSGYLISLTNLLTSLSAVIWVPLVFLFFIEAIKKKSYFFSILVGLTLSLQFLVGQPEVVYMTLFMLGFYLLFDIVWFIKQHKKEKLFHEIKPKLLIFISSIAILSLVSLIQIIPFLELVKNSSRVGGISFKQATYWSFHPLELISLIIPSFSWNLMEVENWFRQYWLQTAFLGIWPVILAGLAFKFRQNYKNRVFFFSLAALSLVLILGKYTPIYYFLYKYIPGLNMIRYPVKFMFLLVFSLAILSGMGIQYIINLAEENKNLFKLMRSLVVMFALVLCGLVFFYLNQTRIVGFLSKYFIPQLSDSGFIKFKTIYIPRILREYSFMMISLGLGVLFICLRYMNKLKLGTFNFLLGGIIFLNLAFINFNSERLIKTQFYRQRGKIVDYIEGKGRILLTPKTYEEVTRTEPVWREWDFDANVYIHSKTLLLCNIGWIYHLFDAGGYSSMRLNRYHNFMNLIHTQPRPSSTVALNLLGVKYLISLWEIDDPGLDLYYKVNYVNIYENKNSLPRASIIPRAVFFHNEGDIQRKIKHPLFDPAKQVVIETDFPLFNSQEPGEGTAEITHYDTNEVDIKANLSKAGWLLLTDTYYPGWKVYIDGKEEKIYKADYLFRAVYLNKGKHNVRFVYEPTSFRAGLTVSVVTILILCALGIYYLVLFRGRKDEK